MYIGRFVILGKTASSQWYLGYRVSSRSFPNRMIVARPDRAMVLPTPDAPKSDNPYISYNCLRTYGGVTVVANGSHVDPIIDKVMVGMNLRDAMALSLLTLDYEKDDYNTPRVAAGLDGDGQGYLGIVTKDKLLVTQMEVAAGQAFLIATYEINAPAPIALEGDTAKALCDAIFECEYEKPVTCVAVMPTVDGLQITTRSARDVGAALDM
jgi:IMP cyclohydrolase